MNIYEILVNKNNKHPLLAMCDPLDYTEVQKNDEVVTTTKDYNLQEENFEVVSIDQALRFVGKKMVKSYPRGEIGVSEILQSYKRNMREADTFCTFGYRIQELHQVIKTTHNPALKAKLSELITEKTILSQKSKVQNQVALAKLDNFKSNVLGMGLGIRRIITSMRKLAKRTRDPETLIVSLLLETEYANLNAKKLATDARKWAYKRKVILLTRLSRLLAENGWKFGYNNATGKNASYLTFIYLPNGVQLTWHCNEYTIPQHFEYIHDDWDGQVCMTLEKILTYIKDNYSEMLLKSLRIAA